MYAVVIIVLMVILFYPFDTPTRSYQDSFQYGYREATKYIEKGCDPQELYDECDCNGAFDMGWMQACLDKGAKQKL